MLYQAKAILHTQSFMRLAFSIVGTPFGLNVQSFVGRGILLSLLCPQKVWQYYHVDDVIPWYPQLFFTTPFLVPSVPNLHVIPFSFSTFYWHPSALLVLHSIRRQKHTYTHAFSRRLQSSCKCHPPNRIVEVKYIFLFLSFLILGYFTDVAPSWIGAKN